MEKSIKRVENLVHVTNTALAQMKFSLMFDDISGETSSKAVDPTFVKKLLEEDDLKRCQGDFKTETDEMLEKVESMFGSRETSRRKSRAVEKIKEINRKMNSLRLDESKPEETEQSRQKLLSLVSEERFSPRELPRELSRPKIPHGVFHKADYGLPKSPIKSKEELKSRLLETQEIVDRGCQTARQLAQQVETMSKLDRQEKSPSTSEIALVEGTENNEILNAAKCRRCLKKKKKKGDSEEEKAARVNTRVIDVRRKEKSNLQVQRLPSLFIKGGLKLQKIHSLEIPAGGDDLRLKSNTSISFFSHDQAEKEKSGRGIERARKEDCCGAADAPRGNYVTCFNCGKSIRVGPTRVDPEEVDKILKQCNFNVFDPRIDEFVEKCGVGASKNWCEETTQGPVERKLSADGVAGPEFYPKKSEERITKDKMEGPEKRSHYTLQNLSDRLVKKYKQEADSIESNRLKLDSILQNIFRQVDESRGVFEKCHFLRNKRERIAGLSTSKPLLITLAGERRHGKRRKSSDARMMKDVGASCRSQKESFPSKSADVKGKQLLIFASVPTTAKGDAVSESKEMPGKSTFSWGGPGDSAKVLEMREAEDGTSPTIGESAFNKSRRSENTLEKGVVEDLPRIPRANSRSAEPSEGVLGEGERRRRSPSRNDTSKKPFEVSPDLYSPLESDSMKNSLDLNIERAEGFSSSSEERDGNEIDGKTFVELPKEKIAASDSSTGKSENCYESDFESPTNECEEKGGECEEDELEAKLCANKLSTIPEEDSELEIKLSNEQKTPRNSQNVGTCKVFEVELAPKKADPGVGISTGSEKTELTPPKNTESTELVTSLKDILSALKDQFARTESLAERLTESTKEERVEKTKSGSIPMEGVTLTPWKVSIGANLVENLRTARKESGGGWKSPGVPRTPEKATREESEKSLKMFSSDSLSDEGGSSLGEIRPSDRRRPSGGSSASECDSAGRTCRTKPRAKTSSGKFDLNVEEASYSEGEVPADELSAVERFGIGSLGEILRSENSAYSGLD